MANSHTLGTDYSPRMWWADIEVPNSAVDMNSWAESACYPRSTFYPLSDDPSHTELPGSTMFLLSHLLDLSDLAVVAFCYCTISPISDRTWVALCTHRLITCALGGNRWSNTTMPGPRPGWQVRVKPQRHQGGISGRLRRRRLLHPPLSLHNDLGSQCKLQ